MMPNDPRPTVGDQFVSEQVELIFIMNGDVADHQTDINDFLITLREDIEHVAVIREIKTQVISTAGPISITALTEIHYALYGSKDLPYLP
jgi:hypothetical protein